MNPGRQFVLVFAASLAVTLSNIAHAEKLPLKDGLYTSAECRGDQTVYDYSILILTQRDPGTGADPFISPDAEGNMGNCAIRKVTVAGRRYSGTAPCRDGNGNLPSGMYRFDYDVIDRMTFVSRKKVYHWCADSR